MTTGTFNEGYGRQEPVYPIYGHDKTPSSSILGVPRIEKSAALICLLLNVFFPGFGTLLGSLMAPSGCDFCGIIYGLLQIALAGFLIGWIWSIIWGLLMYQSSYQHNVLY
eukprot:gene1415-12035_t